MTRLRTSVLVLVVLSVGVALRLVRWRESATSDIDRAESTRLDTGTPPRPLAPRDAPAPATVRSLDPDAPSPTLKPSPLAAPGTANAPVRLPAAPASAESSDLRDAGARYPLSQDGISSAMVASLPQIGDCYREWLRVQPTLEGTLRVRFTVDTDDGVTGVVRGVSLGDAGIGHLPMEGCVQSVMEDLRFDAPQNGPLNITYPIELFSGADGGMPPY